MVNDAVVARGEVVLVNDRYGVRLTQVISAADWGSKPLAVKGR